MPTKTLEKKIDHAALSKAKSAIYKGMYYLHGALQLADVPKAIEAIKTNPKFNSRQKEVMISNINAAADAAAIVMLEHMQQDEEWAAADKKRLEELDKKKT